MGDTTKKSKELRIEGKTVIASEDSMLRADVPWPPLAPAVAVCFPCWLLLVGGELRYEEQGFKEVLCSGESGLGEFLLVSGGLKHPKDSAFT